MVRNAGFIPGTRTAAALRPARRSRRQPEHESCRRAAESCRRDGSRACRDGNRVSWDGRASAGTVTDGPSAASGSKGGWSAGPGRHGVGRGRRTDNRSRTAVVIGQSHTEQAGRRRSENQHSRAGRARSHGFHIGPSWSAHSPCTTSGYQGQPNIRTLSNGRATGADDTERAVAAGHLLH